jgi:hypothetical protein
VHAPQSVVFDTSSFSLLSCSERGPGQSPLFADALFFVTRAGNLDNLSSRESNLLIHRLASDLELDDDLSDEAALNGLRLSLASTVVPKELTTSEVIDLLDDLRLSDQILVLG